MFPPVTPTMAAGDLGELMGLSGFKHGFYRSSVPIACSRGGRWDGPQRLNLPFFPQVCVWRQAGAHGALQRCVAREESLPQPNCSPKQGARGSVTVFLVLFYITLSAIEVILLLCFIVRGSHGTSIEGIAKVA